MKPEDEALPALEIRNLTKIYSKSVRALNGVSLTVRRGEIFGLLGPNGAGKTTLVKASLTLTNQTSGEVSVMGFDTLRRRSMARRLMGYVPQEVSVDRDLTGYENLLLFSKLFSVGRTERSDRIRHALETLGLAERADDLVKTYSGGMMRRLEIAQTIVNRPKLLFLDEPSVGLDPTTKREVWELIRQLRAQLETTILITTHDMVEAEQLCDRVAIINDGMLVIAGTPKELRALVGGEVVNIRLGRSKEGKRVEEVRFPPELGAAILGGSPDGKKTFPEHQVSVVVKAGAEEAALGVAKAFESSGFEVESLSYSRPSLDDVFLKFTRTRIGEAESSRQAEGADGRRLRQ